MIRKNVISVIGLVLFASAILFLINWYFVAKSQNIGIWILIGNSIGYASVLIFGLITAIYAFHEITKRKGVEDNSALGFTNQLPKIDELFTGRKEQLDQLLSQHRRGENNIFGIYGMGGLGKTTLGIAFANQIAKNYNYRLFYNMRGSSNAPASEEDVMLYVVRSFNMSFSFSFSDDIFIINRSISF